MRSLQTRLSAGLIVSLALFFSLQWLIVSGSIRYLTENYVAARLRHDADNLLAALTFGGEAGGPDVNPEKIDPVYKRPFSGHYYRIVDGDRALRSRSLWDQDLSIPSVPVGAQNLFRHPGPQGQNLLVLNSGFRKQGREISIAVSEDLSPIEADIRRFQLRYGLVSLAVLILLIVIQRWIVAAGLRPLQKARDDVSALERGEMKQLREEAPDEVKPFLHEINRLLEAMGQRLKRSRNATGNLAHALKAPLTLLLQLADRDEMRAHPDLRDELIEQTGVVRHLIDRELKRARLAGSSPPGAPSSLRDEIPHLIDALTKIYQEKPLEIETSLPTRNVVIGDREDMLELFGNLLDNAAKWAKRKVALKVEEEKDILISVEDDGPGCAPEELRRLSRRGVRVDESAVGHGLGLAIVKDIVDQYSGEIGFGRSERLGGFKVWVQLPSRPKNKEGENDRSGSKSP